MHNRCNRCNHSPRSKFHQVHCMHKVWHKHPHSGRHAPTMSMRAIRGCGAIQSALGHWRDADLLPVDTSFYAEQQGAGR